MKYLSINSIICYILYNKKLVNGVSEKDNTIEIFDSEDEIIVKPLNNEDLYDLKGNLITVDDAKNTLPDNDELIQKAIDGDKKAFETLYMQSYRYVFFVVRQFVPDDETTYDALQETFIKVYKGINRLRSPKAYYGWITVIAKNTARDFMRTARFENSLSYETEDYSVFLKDDETQNDVSLDVETVLKKLDSEDADLLSLVYYDGMRISQIAKMQGVPATTIYSRFNKAKRNLKAQLNAHGIDKAIYSGNFISMITVAIRNIIGTALLSVAIAQQILDSIINGKGKKELAVAQIIRAQQKKAILKIASVIVAISVVTSAATALTLIDWSRFKFSGDDNYLTSTVTEYYYETTSGDNASQNNNGGFWQNLFGGGNGSSNNSGGSSDTVGENSSKDLYNSQNTSTNSGEKPKNDGSSQNSSSTFPSLNGNLSIPSTQPDDTTVNDEVVNVFGNNPNNVMQTSSLGGLPFGCGLVAKQGDWLYYVQNYARIIKVKTDGTGSQLIAEVTGFSTVSSLNVVGDTIYYVSSGIWSVKTDGTNRKHISSKSATNLLVRDTTGWFIVQDNITNAGPRFIEYDLYQIDLLTGDTKLLVENGSGHCQKTVVDNTLVYVNGNKVYTYDLLTGKQSVIATCDSASNIDDMRVNGDTIYISYSFNTVDEINLNVPNVIQNSYPFGGIYNYFNYNGGVVFAAMPHMADQNFYTLQGDALCEANSDIYYEYGVYTFDDGYAYWFGQDNNILYRCLPDGSDFKAY